MLNPAAVVSLRAPAAPRLSVPASVARLNASKANRLVRIPAPRRRFWSWLRVSTCLFPADRQQARSPARSQYARIERLLPAGVGHAARRSLPFLVSPVVVCVSTVAGREAATSCLPEGRSRFIFSSLSAASSRSGPTAGACAPRPISQSHRGFVVQGRGAHVASSTLFPFGGGYPLQRRRNVAKALWRAVAYPPGPVCVAARSAPPKNSATHLARRQGGERRRRAAPFPSPASPFFSGFGGRPMQQSRAPFRAASA